MSQCIICGREVGPIDDLGRLSPHKYRAKGYSIWKKGCPGAHRVPHKAVADMAVMELQFAIADLENVPPPAPGSVTLWVKEIIPVPSNRRKKTRSVRRTYTQPTNFTTARAPLLMDPYSLEYLRQRRLRREAAAFLRAQASAIRQRRKIFLTPLDSTQAMALS